MESNFLETRPGVGTLEENMQNNLEFSQTHTAHGPADFQSHQTLVIHSTTATTVVPIALMINTLSYFVCTHKAPDLFWSNEGLLLDTLSIMLKKELYIFDPYDVRGYDVVVKHIFNMNFDSRTVKQKVVPCFLSTHERQIYHDTLGRSIGIA